MSGFSERDFVFVFFAVVVSDLQKKQNRQQQTKLIMLFETKKVLGFVYGCLWKSGWAQKLGVSFYGSIDCAGLTQCL